MKYYLKELRVHHYIKNLLIFVALFCSGQLFDLSKLKNVLYGFMAFCLISSAIYIFNDICDIEKDKVHPTKCNRPIASGIISVKSAWIMVAVLILLGGLFNYLIFSFLTTLLLVLYVVLNVLYSIKLKDIPILDVTILVFGFVVRLIYGARISSVEISDWLYLTVFALSFYFALGKRRNELMRVPQDNTRTVLKYYSKSFLDKNMYMCLGIANVFYALWAIEKDVISSNHFVWTVPVVLLICLKYSLDIEGDSDGDPVEVLTHDKILLLLCCVYVVVVTISLYL